VADIPGLIKDAHRGKGLGFQFLRHIERTRLLLHLVDISETSPGDPVSDFETIRQEISLYSPELTEKRFAVVPTKTDIKGSGKKLKKMLTYCKARGLEAFPISAATRKGLKALLNHVGHQLDSLKSSEQSGAK
jgi:GTP-binding protein